MTTVGICGLGLIGASIAKTLKMNSSYNIIGFDREASVVARAISDGSVDSAYTSMDNTVDCDIVIFATPPAITLELINSCTYKAGATVCDVCGVKGFMKDIHPHIDFVGMHPMAGKETSGYSSSDSTLFAGANLLLVKRESTSMQACKNAEELGKALGFAVLEWTDPKTHDKLIGFTSQMPHVLSSVIVSHPLYDQCHSFEGGSLNDFTRIARLDAPMWTSLFLANKDNLKQECQYYIDSLTHFQSLLDDESALQGYLQNAREKRVDHERT